MILFQFTYNKSLCKSNKYPEINAEDPTREIEVAPGEGKIPKDIMREKDWDILMVAMGKMKREKLN